MDQPLTEHVIKGMRYFRYRNVTVLLEDARKSPYFLWWSCLRRSKDYWWACHRQGRVSDIRLRKMYYDFGDVYSMSFESWWKKIGLGLFTEQIALPDVRKLDPLNLKLTRGLGKHLLLEIPLNMTERTIIQKVRQLLRKEPEREVMRKSSATRALARYVRLKTGTLETALKVWQLNHESKDPGLEYRVGQVNGSKSHYQIGKELKLVSSCMPVFTDDAKRAAKRVNGMKVAVSRMLTRANHLIDNACVGVFPSSNAMTEPISWSPIAKKYIEEALNQNLWKPLFDENETLMVPQLDD
jgi:hypothetical protein